MFKSKKRFMPLVALSLAMVMLVSTVIPTIAAGTTKATLEDPVDYTYVLVHGMGGWGESAGMNNISPYWGSFTGSLSEYLRSEGYKVEEATVGPFSSAWDRACELYAQLTGTTVDYGEAHSKEHGHERYGRTYATPLVEGWGETTADGQINKINLVGHSFGGNTVSLLTSLLAYGDTAEMKASPNDCSSLFKGGKENWVHSVTTLCTPHNGSTLYYCLDKGKLVSSALDILYVVGGAGSSVNSSYIDFQLEHFGIESGKLNTINLINKKFSEGKDNAFYDLSPDGAAELNKSIKTVDSVYYFSYAFSTTRKAAFSKNQLPIASTLIVLQPIATLMGRYTNISPNATIKIDNSWLPNDGLVNVVSAQYPFDENHVDCGNKPTNVKTGIWYVFPTQVGDHGDVIGMDGKTNKTHKFYVDHFTLIDSLPRR